MRRLIPNTVNRQLPSNAKQKLLRLHPETRHFSPFHTAQTGSVAHPASYSIGTGGFFPGEKRPGVKLTAHLHLVPRLRMRGATSPLPSTSSWHRQG